RARQGSGIWRPACRCRIGATVGSCSSTRATLAATPRPRATYQSGDHAMTKGHIRQRGGKRGVATWELKFDADRAEGGRQTVYRSFKGSKREAQAELTRLLAQAQAGEYVEPSKLSVVDYVRSRIKQWHASGTISQKTSERYEELATYQLGRFAIGSRPLQKLTAADIEAWHNELKTSGRQRGDGGVSTQTISHAHRLLSSALRDAVR